MSGMFILLAQLEQVDFFLLFLYQTDDVCPVLENGQGGHEDGACHHIGIAPMENAEAQAKSITGKKGRCFVPRTLTANPCERLCGS